MREKYKKRDILSSPTPSGPMLGGPNTGNTVGGALLGSPGGNITKLATILPLSYLTL